MSFQNELGPTDAGAPFGSSAAPAKTSSKARRWVGLVLVLALIVFGYGAWRLSAARQSDQASGGPRERGGPNSMPVPVVVAQAQRADMPVYLNGLGTVTAFNTVTAKSRVDGQLVNVAFREGQFVRKGELLAQIDPRPFQVQLEQAEGQLAKDEALLRDAKLNAERYVKLSREGVIPQQQSDTQVAQAAQYDGAIKSDQAAIDDAKLQLTYCRITAPISGRIGLRLVDPGNIVHATDANGLLVITQLQPIAVIFTLPQDQLPEVYQKLRSGAKLPVDAYDRDDTTKIASGTLLTIDNQIDPTTGTYKLKAVFHNEDNALYPNQFVNMHLLVDTRRGLTEVPTAAVQRGPQGTYVYVVGSDSTVKIRPFTESLTVGNSVGLSSGLQPGEVVVTDGQDKLQDGSKIDARSPTGGLASGNASSGGSPSSRGGHRGGQGGKGKSQ